MCTALAISLLMIVPFCDMFYERAHACTVLMLLKCSRLSWWGLVWLLSLVVGGSVVVLFGRCVARDIVMHHVLVWF